MDLFQGLLAPAVFGNLTLQAHGRMVVQGGNSGFEDIQLGGIIISTVWVLQSMLGLISSIRVQKDVGDSIFVCLDCYPPFDGS